MIKNNMEVEPMQRGRFIINESRHDQSNSSNSRDIVHGVISGNSPLSISIDPAIAQQKLKSSHEQEDKSNSNEIGASAAKTNKESSKASDKNYQRQSSATFEKVPS